MKPNTHPQDDSPTPELPAALLDAMRGLDDPVGFDDRSLADLDNAVLSGARQHLESFAQRRRLRLIFTCAAAGSGLAAAAAITLVIWMGGLGTSNNTSPIADHHATDPKGTATQLPTTAAGDFDANGDINILDAFAMARQVRTGETPEALLHHDLNADGQVDQADISALARRAVSLRAPLQRGQG